MVNQLEHLQGSTVVPFFSKLLEHSEFRLGIVFGRDIYYDLAYEGMLTEEELVALVERNLSCRARKASE